MMTKQAKYSLLKFAVLSVFTIVPFQNCAPTGAIVAGADNQSAAIAANGVTAGGSSDSHIVTVIDDVNRTTALAFEKSAEEADGPESSFALDGTCDGAQAGATLGWALREAVGAREIASGHMGCVAAGAGAGAFRVELAALMLPECGRAYLLEARLGLGKPGRVLVRRACR